MNNKTIFLITPIGEEGSPIYKKHFGIYTVINSIVKKVDPEFEVIRADQIARPGSFVTDILEYIRNSYIVIANLTGLNPNVFYELGVRHCLSPRTIMIIEDLTAIPSDLREYRVFSYSADITKKTAGISQKKKLAEFELKLTSTLKQILKEPTFLDNPVLKNLAELHPPIIIGKSPKTENDKLLNEFVTHTIEAICRSMSTPYISKTLRIFIFRERDKILECSHFWAQEKTEEMVEETWFPANEENVKKIVVVEAFMNKKVVGKALDSTDQKQLASKLRYMSKSLRYVLAAPIFVKKNNIRSAWGVVDFDTSDAAGQKILESEYAESAIYKLAECLGLLFELKEK